MACKIIKKASLNPRLQQNLKNEISILSRIQHKNVIQLYDIQKTTNNFYLFMQYCNGGDLEHLREIRGRFSEQEARFFLSQIIKGFQAIHQMNVVHRDLKLANILINFHEVDMDQVLAGGEQLRSFKKQVSLIGKCDVVIADLGFAKQLDEENLAKTQCGTPLYMAPEILRGE
jgi:serine/threonine-protein kinase ULK/ATG1